MPRSSITRWRSPLSSPFLLRIFQKLLLLALCTTSESLPGGVVALDEPAAGSEEDCSYVGLLQTSIGRAVPQVPALKVSAANIAAKAVGGEPWLSHGTLQRENSSITSFLGVDRQNQSMANLSMERDALNLSMANLSVEGVTKNHGPATKPNGSPATRSGSSTGLTDEVDAKSSFNFLRSVEALLAGSNASESTGVAAVSPGSPTASLEIAATRGTPPSFTDYVKAVAALAAETTASVGGGGGGALGAEQESDAELEEGESIGTSAALGATIGVVVGATIGVN
ncbi:unnamed protein product [Polarella glacialis]|uniref:Uncharacterized protein n=1 Tax=Polarella glacialis TaxID=89957 RepID=A0A813GIF4_POLGL|nr:unnamed protein product [Polarella glacialis]